MMVCERPAKRGSNAGNPATGTPGGYTRHYRAGEPACDECLTAHNAAAQQWYADHPEVWSQVQRRSYAKHQEKRRAYSRQYAATHPGYQRQWYEANREQRLAVGRKWVEANRDRVLAYHRQWNQENPDRRAAYEKRWRDANPEKVTEFARRRRARVLAASIVTFSDDQLNQRMAYWGYRCWMCGGPFEAVDHVKPLARGGPHILANLRPSCNACNRRKWAFWDGVEGLAI